MTMNFDSLLIIFLCVEMEMCFKLKNVKQIVT